MTSPNFSRRFLHYRLKSAITVLALVSSLSLLATGCSVTDLINPGNSDDAPSLTPTATAQPGPTPTPEPVRKPRDWPELRHRYIVTPPTESYDPEIITATKEEQYIAEVSDQWARTSSVHFNLDVDGATYLDVNETIELKSVEGDLKRPDQTQAKAKVQIGFASFDVGIVVIGDNAYTTNFLTGDWERGPSNFDFNPALLFDNERGVSAVLQKMNDVEVGAESTIGATRTVELTGTVAQEDIADLVANSLAGDEIGVSLWLNAETGSLLEIKLSEPGDAAGDPTAWVISFSGHNQPVRIEAPDL